jgi:hypothetical protein
MKIGMVTTWGSQCGISTYSENLSKALVNLGHDVIVFSPSDGDTNKRKTDPRIPSIISWSRDCHNLTDYLQKGIQSVGGVDVLHFQHEFGLFNNSQLFLQSLSDLSGKFKCVITPHTLFPYGGWRGSGFIDGLVQFSYALIAHTPRMAAVMGSSSGYDHTKIANILLIPHGCENSHLGNREKGLEILNIPNQKRGSTIALCFGFQSKNKNTIGTIKAFGKAFASGILCNCILVICGRIHDTYFNPMYSTILETGYPFQFVLSSGFVRDEDVNHIMAASDFSVLNTQDDALSASGQAQLLASYGVPFAVANAPIYHDGIVNGAMVYDHHPQDKEEPTTSFLNVISSLANNSKIRLQVGHDVYERSGLITWPKIAKRTEELAYV